MLFPWWTAVVVVLLYWRFGFFVSFAGNVLMACELLFCTLSSNICHNVHVHEAGEHLAVSNL